MFFVFSPIHLGCIKNFYRKQAEKTNKQTDKNQTLEQGVK